MQRLLSPVMELTNYLPDIINMLPHIEQFMPGRFGTTQPRGF